MDEKEIYRLFLEAARNPSDLTDETRQVFTVLVNSTLGYRDHLLFSRGITLTVGEVRNALDWLVPSLLTGRLPETENKVSLDLVKLWLDELKTQGNPMRYLT